ncbi:hypothetical protein Q0P29_14280, partial [Staphylococcus aureus]|nr:hypothetical protein [Staphylococcus aureus]
HQKLSLTDAYAQATSEFVALRGAHEMSTLAAAAEARHFGATFKRDEWVGAGRREWVLTATRTVCLISRQRRSETAPGTDRSVSS